MKVSNAVSALKSQMTTKLSSRSRGKSMSPNVKLESNGTLFGQVNKARIDKRPVPSSGKVNIRI